MYILLIWISKHFIRRCGNWNRSKSNACILYYNLHLCILIWCMSMTDCIAFLLETYYDEIILKFSFILHKSKASLFFLLTRHPSCSCLYSRIKRRWMHAYIEFDTLIPAYFFYSPLLSDALLFFFSFHLFSSVEQLNEWQWPFFDLCVQSLHKGNAL